MTFIAVRCQHCHSEQTPERLTELDGIGPKRKQRVVEAWEAQKIIPHSNGFSGSPRGLGCGEQLAP